MIFTLDIKSEDSIPYAGAVSEIIRCQDDVDPHNVVDKMMEQLGVDLVVRAFLSLIDSSCYRDEDRSVTIELMTYLAFKDNLPEDRKCDLQYELREFLSWDRYEEYTKHRVVGDLEMYKQMLSKMLLYGINTYPKWMSDLIDKIAPKEEGSFQTCVYSIEEISEILLEFQRVYYEQWRPTDGVSGVRSFLSKGYMNRHSSYTKQALQALVSLIKKYPVECIWVVLDQSYAYYSLTIVKLELSVNKALLNQLEEQGLSLDAWLDLIEDKKYRYVLDYARSIPEGDPVRYIDPLPDDETDRYSIDYIYRAILEQEKGCVSRLSLKSKTIELWGKDKVSSFCHPREKNTGQLADAGWPVLYVGGGLCALHLHHTAEAHESHGKDACGDESNGDASHTLG